MGQGLGPRCSSGRQSSLWVVVTAGSEGGFLAGQVGFCGFGHEMTDGRYAMNIVQAGRLLRLVAEASTTRGPSRVW